MFFFFRKHGRTPSHCIREKKRDGGHHRHLIRGQYIIHPCTYTNTKEDTRPKTGTVHKIRNRLLDLRLPASLLFYHLVCLMPCYLLSCRSRLQQIELMSLIPFLCDLVVWTERLNSDIHPKMQELEYCK